MSKSPRWRFIIALWLAILFGFASCESRAADVEPFVTYTHTSDIFRGCPFKCDRDESTQEAIMGGVTIAAGKRRAWELDIAHGVKAIDCGGVRNCKWEQGSQFSARWYPWRNR
jgi:hypothetical protein